jgi:hypothetical protein
VVDDFNLINVRRTNSGLIVTEVHFFNKNDQLVGIMLENSWSSERSKTGGNGLQNMLNPKRLTIRNKRSSSQESNMVMTSRYSKMDYTTIHKNTNHTKGDLRRQRSEQIPKELS